MFTTYNTHCTYTMHLECIKYFTKTNTVCLAESLKDCNWSLKDACEEMLESLQRNTHSAYRHTA